MKLLIWMVITVVLLAQTLFNFRYEYNSALDIFQPKKSGYIYERVQIPVEVGR